jgi:hypothetical protein
MGANRRCLGLPGRQVLAAAALCIVVAVSALAETLQGRVVEDHSGQAVVAARVRVLRLGETRLAADLDTDSSGRFQADVPAGDYRLSFSKPNYVDTELRLVVPQAGSAFDFPVRLVRHAVITGRVTDAQSRAVRGAFVLAMRRPVGGERLQPSRPVQTDERGEYRLHGLGPGEYAVAVSLAAFRTGVGAGAWLYPTNSQPTFFAIAGGEEYRGVDFAFLAPSLHAVSGTVDAPEAATGYAVSLAAVDQPALQVATAVTDKGGGFAFEGIPPGSYHLFASGPVRGYGGRQAMLASEPLFGRARVEIVGGDRTGLSIALRPGRSARFLLRPEPGMAKGCPAKAMLSLAPLEDWGASTEKRLQVTTDQALMAADLAPGRYEASVMNLGDACFPDGAVAIDLADGDASEAIVVPIAGAGSIRGRLLTGAADPTAFAVVLVAPGATGSMPPLQVAFPGEDARFTFTGLRPGDYRIAAQPAAHSATRWVADLSRMFEIEVPAGAPTDVDLPVAGANQKSP